MHAFGAEAADDRGHDERLDDAQGETDDGEVSADLQRREAQSPVFDGRREEERDQAEVGGVQEGQRRVVGDRYQDREHEQCSEGNWVVDLHLGVRIAAVESPWNLATFLPGYRLGNAYR